MYDAFVIHYGFKSMSDMHASRDRDLNKSRRVFGQMKKKLLTKYPHVSPPHTTKKTPFNQA
jgi:hypothetical protein